MYYLLLVIFNCIGYHLYVIYIICFFYNNGKIEEEITYAQHG